MAASLPIPAEAREFCSIAWTVICCAKLTWTFVAVTGVLLVVLLSNQFARVLGQAAANDFPAGIVLTLIGLTTLQQLTVLVPIGLFLGIVLALGRLYHESEMTAMAACGVGPLRIYRPIALLALVVAAALAVLSFRIVPAAWQKSNEPAPRGDARGAVRRARARPLPQLRRRRRGLLRRAGREGGRTLRRVRAAQRRRQARGRDGRARGAARRRAGRADLRAVRRPSLRGRARPAGLAHHRVPRARHPVRLPEAQGRRTNTDRDTQPRPRCSGRTSRAIAPNSPGASPCR